MKKAFTHLQTPDVVEPTTTSGSVSEVGPSPTYRLQTLVEGSTVGYEVKKAFHPLTLDQQMCVVGSRVGVMK